MATRKVRSLSEALKALDNKPSDVFARRLVRVRNRKGWSQRELSDVLASRYGVRIDPASIARLEKGERDVSLNEAFMLAAVLDVAPLHMMVPTADQDPVDVAPWLSAPAEHVRAWARGARATKWTDEAFYISEMPPAEVRSLVDRAGSLLEED